MMIQIFNIPSGVVCKKKTALDLKVAGSKGAINLWMDSSIVQKSQLLFFTRSLSGQSRTDMHRAFRGAVRCFRINLRLKGIGYYIQDRGDHYIFHLGYSRPVIIDIPGLVSAQFKRRKIRFESPYYNLLTNFVINLRSYRYPTIYKGKGIRYRKERIKLKEGKKN